MILVGYIECEKCRVRVAAEGKLDYRFGTTVLDITDYPDLWHGRRSGQNQADPTRFWCPTCVQEMR